MSDKISLEDLLSVISRVASRGWCPATGGNFSKRIDENTFTITRSGEDKSSLTSEGFLTCPIEGGGSISGETPSAETPIHRVLYKIDPSIACVLHTHTVPATVLSKHHLSEGAIAITGFEMLKSIRGFESHEETLSIPIIPNTQDMEGCAAMLQSEQDRYLKTVGFILSGHGLYAWGSSPQEALRHIEGFEFLFESLLMEQILSK